MSKSDEIWNKRFLNNKSSILLVYMPVMPLVSATPNDLSFTVKGIEVSAFIEGATSIIRWTSLWTRKIYPFSSFCSFDTLNDADNTLSICEKQPLSHVFLNKYVIHLVIKVLLGVIHTWCQWPVTCKQSIIHSYLAKYFINNTKGFDRKVWQL